MYTQIFRNLFFELETENDYVQPTDDPLIIIVYDKNETFDIFKELVDLKKKISIENNMCLPQYKQLSVQIRAHHRTSPEKYSRYSVSLRN